MVSHYIFVDTSAWFALFDKSDDYHQQAKGFFETNAVPLLTSNFILTETLTLVKSRLGNSVSLTVGRKFFHESIASVIEIDRIALEAGWNIFQKYNDKGFSFTDCTTFAIMERLTINSAFTFDEHFKQYGKFKCLPSEKI